MHLSVYSAWQSWISKLLLLRLAAPGLKLWIYLDGYLNQVQSSQYLERERGRNPELNWLIDRSKPDFKTIADFGKDNGPAIREVYQQFVALCRDIKLPERKLVAIDGSRFRAMNAKAQDYSGRAIAKAGSSKTKVPAAKSAASGGGDMRMSQSALRNSWARTPSNSRCAT